MSRTIRIDHLARVEGHGGIMVEFGGEAPPEVRFEIFEGARLLETLVKGRGYEDIAPILSRICSICSTSHAVTSLRATEDAFGVRASAQTEMLRELMRCGENIESHALHLFLLAAPDYLGYPGAAEMAADHPEAVKLGLRLKKLGNTIQEAIGGRAIHPVTALAGGFGSLPSTAALIGLRSALSDALKDGDTAVELLASLPPANFCRSDPVFAALRDGTIVVRSNGSEEYIAPQDYRSLTNETVAEHSNAKHSLYKGRPFMVGALARITVNRDRLTARGRHAMQRLGLAVPSVNPMNNNKAQAVELVMFIEQALAMVECLLDGGLRKEAPVEIHPRAGTGTAVTEAPRGLLVHSYTYDERGSVAAADVVTPTAMNAASVESDIRHLIEQHGDKDVAALTREVEMLSRAYDPCISCSVHVLRRRHAH